MVTKESRRLKIKKRVRGKISGTAERPRLAVYRSNRDIYVQLIDDAAGLTIVSASSREKGFVRSGNKSDQSKSVGAAIAAKASAKGISNVVFDRGGYLYHGRVKALAEGAREAGLKF
ncbi:MAG: 50S ribosomal protein L18 [Chitinophagales bacterium]